MEKTITLFEDNGIEMLVTYEEGTDYWELGKVNDWIRIDSVELVIASIGVELKRYLSERQIEEIADRIRDME